MLRPFARTYREKPIKWQCRIHLLGHNACFSITLQVMLNFVIVIINAVILLHEKFLQFDWLRVVVVQLYLKYLHVKITNLLRVVV